MSPLTSVMEVKGFFDVLLFCARLFYIRAPCFCRFLNQNHKVIFDYLFKSSYMPVYPIVTGFSGIFHCGRYSQIFLYPRMFWYSKVVCGVVNSPFTTYAISRFISVIDVSEVVCA